MSSRGDSGPSWFPLPCQFPQDAELILVSVPAQLLFLRILSLCAGLQTQGRISTAQVQTLFQGMNKPKQYLSELCTAALLTLDGPGTGPVQEYVVSNADYWLKLSNQRPSIPAAKKANAPTEKGRVRPHGGAHPPARVEKEREKEREEGRTPSGSVRPSSAQAAPRGTGGATQPAPVVEIPEGGRLTRAEATANIRETLNRAKQTVSGSTGRDTRLSKYDPDRPIEPLKSGFGMGGGTE